MSKDTKELPKPIVSHNHGLDLLHPSLRPQTRFMLGHLAIAGDLTTGSSDGLSDSLRRAGYADPEEFWEGSLSEPMTIDDFIFFISSLNFSPQMNAPYLIKIALRDLLKQAAQTEQAFVLKAGLIDPRGAVIWLLSMPRRRSLIPVELAQHIEGSSLNVLRIENPTATGKPVAESDLRNYLKSVATRQHTKSSLKTLANQEFSGRQITDSRFEAAYKALPADQKRSRGDTARTLACHNDAK